MTEHAIRFCVVSDDGRSSDIWKCWTNSGKGKRDVYLTSRPLGNTLKLSLHESGQWHVGYLSNKRDKLFEAGKAPETRFLGKWLRPESLINPIVLAARLYVPFFSPTESPRNISESTIRIQSAPTDHAVEVTIFLLSPKVTTEGWPGRNNMQTQLIGNLPLEGGGRVSIVHRCTNVWPSLPDRTVVPKLFKGKSPADLSKANRMVAWAEETDGSIVFIELPIKTNNDKKG
jgi:hypothetical protein